MIDNHRNNVLTKRYIAECSHAFSGFSAEKTGKIPLYLPVTISSFV